MIEILPRYKTKGPVKTVVIQRPFHYLSRHAPLDIGDYRTWLFRKLLTSKTAIDEFTKMLDVVIQEGDLILQCSCIPPKPCHATVIKAALEWAEPFGIEDWHNQLKKVASSNLSKRRQGVS